MYGGDLNGAKILLNYMNMLLEKCTYKGREDKCACVVIVGVHHCQTNNITSASIPMASIPAYPHSQCVPGITNIQ